MIRNYLWFKPRPLADLADVESIHHVLRYGSLEEVAELRTQLGLARLRQVFLSAPQKIYTPAALHFISQYVLKIDTPVNDRAYLTTAPRHS